MLVLEEIGAVWWCEKTVEEKVRRVVVGVVVVGVVVVGVVVVVEG